MKRNVIVLLLIGTCLALVASGAQADTGGIPSRAAYCNVNWGKGLYFRGNVLTVNATIRCTRPMKSINGYAALLRIRMGGVDDLGSPSPQASASDKFFLVQASYHQFTLSHVCKPTTVAYKWWFTVATTARYKAWSKPQTRQNFSHTVITDCG